MKGRRVGSLRNRLQVQRTLDARDLDGGVVADWSTVATVWGAVEPARGDEPFLSGRFEGQVTHLVVIRYGLDLAALGPKYRVLFGARALEIVGVVNKDERNRILELACFERV